MADLNEHHFFSAKELTNMSDYDQTKPSKNDTHGIADNFSDRLRQVPRCESQQIRVHDVVNPLYSSRQEYDVASNGVGGRLPKEAKSSKRQKKPWKVSTTAGYTKNEEERDIWNRYHMYLKEKYRVQSTMPVKMDMPTRQNDALPSMTSKTREQNSSRSLLHN